VGGGIWLGGRTLGEGVISEAELQPASAKISTRAIMMRLYMRVIMPEEELIE
jgi:hypothetical protein